MRRFDALAGALDATRREEARTNEAKLEAQLEAIVATARAEWDDLEVDEKRFLSLVAERLDPALPLADALAALRTSELWIVCGCATGDPRSLAAFEAKYFSEIAGAMRRVPRARLSEDDVAQLVREKLFVARAGAHPKVLEYRGQGSLRAWLRVTAARIALNLATRGPREQPEDSEWFARVVGEGDHPEIAHLKLKYRADFRASLEVAVTALEPRERNVLAYSFGDRLSIDQIGGIYGVHRATAARWIASAQEKLVQHTRQTLMQRLGATPAEIDSIVHLIASRFDVSFGGMLGKGRRDD